MKAYLKTQIAMVSVIILVLTYLFPTAASAAADKPSKTDQVAPFRKILIKGNVEVLLIQRSKVGVSYTDDNEGAARITQQGDVLSITGASVTTGKLIVYVSEIYRIEADENAIVKTQGILSVKYLQIILKGNAIADVNTTSQQLYTAIYDNSTLYLRGNTDTHFLVMDKTQKLTFDQFAVLHTQLTDL
jgi:translation elongation factor P/translation initiation factor 5A